MKSVAGLPPAFFLLLTAVLLPARVMGARTSASMEVTVRVVRGPYSAATAAILIAQIEQIATATVRRPAGPLGNGKAACSASGSRIMVNGVWATCSWDPDTHRYLVTILY
jgi:hypothetical protein